jgi:hypothetical protein
MLPIEIGIFDRGFVRLSKCSDLHNKRAIQPIRTDNGTGDLLYSLSSNMGLPLPNFILHYSSGTAAAVLMMSSLDINLLPLLVISTSPGD